MPQTLVALFRPKSIAVIGASRRRDAIGGAILHNLLESGFQGPVYPVNPTATHVQSVPAYPTIEAIPGPVDLAVIVIPAKGVLEAVEACGQKKVKSIRVVAPSFVVGRSTT